MKITPIIVNPQGTYFVYVIISVFILSSVTISRKSTQEQQGLCPKQCNCDNQNLEVICKGKLQASSIPHTFNPYTKRLVLNYGQTTSLIGVDYMAKLEYLDLAHNRISSIEFDRLTNLVSLNISHNNIIELKDTNLMTSMVELNINLSTINQGVDLESFKVLGKLTKINIVELNLAQNNISTIRNLTFIRWHKLLHLDLSHNQIATIEPLALFGLGLLETLNLRNNLLVHVPTTALHSTVLTISSPVFSSQAHARPSSIKYLDLSENTLRHIGPESFELLEKAQDVHLESCSIQSIDDQAFKGLDRLYSLSLDKNNLQEVPSKAFNYLGLLRSLKMNANNFSTIYPKSFTGLPHLEELQLNDGAFSELQAGVFDGLDALRRLELGYNHNLTHIALGTFQHMSRLTYLSLYFDSLSSIENVFTDNLTILDLRGNPLYCSCDIKWLTKWLKKLNSTALSIQHIHGTAHLYDLITPVDDTQALLADPLLSNELVNLTCFGPPALQGKPLVELPDNKLECLKPASELNLHIGFGMLFLLTFLLTLVCLLNFCRNKKQWLVMLKENLVQNHISMMISYSDNLNTNVDCLKKETQLYGSDYESIDYHNGQIFTVDRDQMLRHNTIRTQQLYQQEV